jgi:hypothetical protein
LAKEFNIRLCRGLVSLAVADLGQALFVIVGFTKPGVTSVTQKEGVGVNGSRIGQAVGDGGQASEVVTCCFES